MLVWKVRIYTKNFVIDFLQNIKNIVGGRLKNYEELLNKSISETWNDFNNCYPNAKNIRVDTEHMINGSIMVTITGEL